MACYGMLALAAKFQAETVLREVQEVPNIVVSCAKHVSHMFRICFAYVSYPFVPKFVSIAQETGIKGELDGALAETPKESPPFCATVRHQRSTKESSACATRTTFASDRMISSSQ